MSKPPTYRKLISTRRVVWIVALLALGVGMGVYMLKITRERLEETVCPIALVDAKEISNIIMHPSPMFDNYKIFVVDDQATISQILDAMRPVSRDWHPLKWQSYADLQIEFKNGTNIDVSVYRVGEEVAAYSIDRVYYRGGSESKLIDILESEAKKSGVTFQELQE